MKTNQTKPAGYETKAEEYFEETRPEMLPFVPTDCGRVLDVGCGSGGFGETLKRSRTVEVWGVEPVAKAAAAAASRLDRAVEGLFSPQLNLPLGGFDCVIFNDVLEHLFDPAEALSYARQLLSPQGCVVASIPNIRHFPTMWELFIRAEWIYRDFGIMDRTHLRFFTRNSIEPLFVQSGFFVEKLEGIQRYCSLYPNASPSWRCFRIMNALLLHRINDMSFLQFAVVARPNLAPR